MSEFELEQFERSGDRLRVSGRWSGVRGMRFVRPSLSLGDRRILAVLDHKPWAPEEGVQWIAEFPWEGDPRDIDLAKAELSVAPSIIVSLAAPGVPQPVKPESEEDEPDPAEVEAERRRRQQAEISFLRQQIDLLKGRLAETERERDEARSSSAPAPAPTPVPSPERADARERLAGAEAERDRVRAERDEALREVARLEEELAAAPPAAGPGAPGEPAPAMAVPGAAIAPAQHAIQSLEPWFPRVALAVAAVCVLLLAIGVLKIL